MPKEASNHFGERLLPFLKQIVMSDPSKKFEEIDDLPGEIKNAIICVHGQLTPPYKYIAELRSYHDKIAKKQEEYELSMQENLRKASSIKRGMGFATIVFSGSLFQTHFLNTCMDILTAADVKFRIIEWEIGNTYQ